MVTIQQPSMINTAATQPMATANVINQSIKGKSTVIQSDALKSSVTVRANQTKKAFVCDHTGCTKSFDKAALLRKHAKLHSKQCKFVCDVCHKGFESHSKKEDHYRKHTGVKPFLCEICGHSFRYKGDRTKHMRNIHSVSKSPNDDQSQAVTNLSGLTKARLQQQSVSNFPLPSEDTTSSTTSSDFQSISGSI